MDKAHDKVNIFNLGTDGYVEVNQSIAWICEALGVVPQLEYSGGVRGWVGDNPFIQLDVSKVAKLGWQPKLTIREGILRTLGWLKDNDWIYRRRP